MNNKEKKPKRSPFDSKWKDDPYILRNVILFYDFENENKNIEQEFKNFESKIRFLVNYCSKKVHSLLLSKEVSLKDIKSQKFPDILFKNHQDVIDMFKKYEVVKQRLKRSICCMAVRFYKGYGKRNKKLSRLPSVSKQNKAIHFTDGVVNAIKLDKTTLKGELTLANFGSKGKNKKGNDITKTMNVKFHTVKGMMSKWQYLPASPGGNIDIKNKRIILMVKIPIKWKYEPKSAIGFDLNKNAQNFIYFSENVKLEGLKSSRKFTHKKEANILNLQNKMDRLNDLIKSDGMISRRRRRLRKKVKSLHRKLTRLYVGICQSIIDWCVERKKLICIDKLSCGARTGSFGQDKIVEKMTLLCEKQRVPFVYVPTPYTSKACNKCGSKCEDRPQHDKTICEICGEFQSHDNASLNIRDWGWRIWNEGLYKVNKEILDKYKKANSSLN